MLCGSQQRGYQGWAYVVTPQPRPRRWARPFAAGEAPHLLCELPLLCTFALSTAVSLT